MTARVRRVLSIPHGGGPLPIMGDPSHAALIRFLGDTEASIGRPAAIVVVSAHWECPVPTVTAGTAPELIYDYGGFPPETYRLRYPAPGSPELATRIAELCGDAGLPVDLDARRGFDHGMFVPLMLMYPDATIPVVQLSMLSSLDPVAHIAMGAALAPLVDDDVLILGSGFTFHNMRAFGPANPARGGDPDNERFEEWLRDTCTSDRPEAERVDRLLRWSEAPGARWCHPREEHLLPLHVCYGAAGRAAELVFDDQVLGKRASGYAW